MKGVVKITEINHWMHFIVHLLIGKVSLSITDLLVGSIVTRQDSKHFLTFLFTIIDFILIPRVFNFSPISLITYESFQSAWQSAVTRILSTHTASLSFSKVPAASFSEVSSKICPKKM